MTIRITKPWNGYMPDQIVTLGGVEEARLISLGMATADLDGDPDPEGVLVRAKSDPNTGGIGSAQASGRDVLLDRGVDQWADVGGCVMVDWGNASVSIGTPTSGWTVEKSTEKTFAGKTSLKVTATGGAADTMTCTLTIPSTFFGGAKRLVFPVNPGNAYIAGDGSYPVQMWLNYSASTTHRITSYAYSNHAPGDWAEGVCFDQDATGSGHITGTTQWAKVASENVTTITLVMTKRAGQAISDALYIGPIYTDPIRSQKATLTIFMDGQYDGQYLYARQLLQAYGMRASLAVIPYWINDYPTEGAGAFPNTMTAAQLAEMYALGHEFIHHTGTVGPSGSENVGWDNTTKYPDGSEYAGVLADVQASQNWMRENGYERGLGYGVVGFTTGLSATQSLSRRQNIARAVADAGMLAVRQNGTYYGNWYGCARESSMLLTQSRMVVAADATGTVTGIVDQMIARGGWNGLVFHNIKLSGATSNDYNIADMETVIDYVATKIAAGTIRVLPFSEAMKAMAVVPQPQ